VLLLYRLLLSHECLVLLVMSEQCLLRLPWLLLLFWLAAMMRA